MPTAMVDGRHAVDRGGRQYPQRRAADGDNLATKENSTKKYVVQLSCEV